VSDVCIVGAGAAGCEAARSFASRGYDVLLVTTSLGTVFSCGAERVVAAMPTDTFGGSLAPSLRPDSDGTVASWDVHSAAKYALEATPQVHLLQSNVDDLHVEERSDGRFVTAVETWEGVPRAARAVLLCVGPFLKASLEVGMAVEAAGRPGEMAYPELAEALERFGVALRTERHEGGGRDAPTWRGSFARFAHGVVHDGQVRGWENLFAAGIVAHGPMDYGSAARDGARVADRVAAWLDANRS